MMQYRRSPNRSLFWTIFVLITLMVMLEMHSVLGGYYDSSVYGSQRNQVKEQRVEPSWRWRNRNRDTRKRNKGHTAEKRVPKNLYLRNDLTNVVHMESIDSCCPTMFEMIQPIAGRNGTGHLVHLYQDEQVRQRFYEVSCHPTIVNKPCKYLERRYVKLSQCVQQHSLTYALVRPSHEYASNEEQSWILDYITVRSGCTCQVINTKGVKKRGSQWRN